MHITGSMHSYVIKRGGRRGEHNECAMGILRVLRQNQCQEVNSKHISRGLSSNYMY